MGKVSQLIGMAFAPALTVIFGLSFIVLMGWVPPPSPALSADEIAAIYQMHPTRTLVAMFLLMTSMGMIAPFGTAVAVRLRRVETGTPILTYLQIVNCAIATLVVILPPIFWAGAAFRPFETSPELIRMMNDVGCFSSWRRGRHFRSGWSRWRWRYSRINVRNRISHAGRHSCACGPRYCSCRPAWF